MNKLRFSLFIGTTLLVSLALCSTAQAQNRVFVSGVGNDVNPCSRTAPCRNFQRAHDVVAAGGEVVALDPAGYGAVTITKSLTITGEGTYAGITVASGNGVTINSATAVVVLRNLSISGLGTATNGILVTDAAALDVENCIIQRFSAQGLNVALTANSNIQTFVKDTVMRNTGENAIQSGKAVFENCRIEKGNTDGLFVKNGARVNIHNCVIAGHNVGLDVEDPGSQVMVDECQIFNNTIGIRSDMMAQVRVSNSNITRNGTGLAIGTGSILSRTAGGAVTNTLEDNTTNGAFSALYTAK